MTDKTLRSQSAKLITGLYALGRDIFRIEDVSELTGLAPASARSLVRGLVNRAIATRLKPGLFQLVPFELGAVTEYIGNPYLIADQLARGQNYFLSHASAMDMHGMLTQPQLTVFLSTPTPRHPNKQNIHGIEYRFIYAQEKYFFGISDYWIDKQHTVRVSDLEKTIIDCLKQPEYSGGITAVAKAFWISRSKIQITKLVDYALRIDIATVQKRLGYLLDLFNAAPDTQLGRLLNNVGRPYVLLDPTLPNDGIHNAKWKIRLNVEAEEILSIIRT